MSSSENEHTLSADVAATLRAQRSVLQTRFGVRRLGLFGSHARGEAHSGSDIDVLVEFEPGAHHYDNLFDVRTYLRDHLDAEVDVLTPEGLSPYVRPYVERDLVWM